MANLGTLLRDGASEWLAPHELEQSADRFAELAKRLREVLGLEEGREVVLVSAPGRTELAGNHTDHNHGRVLAASVNLDSIAAASRRDDMVVRLASEGFPAVELDLRELGVRSDERETTAALVRGVAAGLAARGRPIGGFDATVSSTVFAGSGLSSSASIEILIGYTMDALYASEPAGPTEIAQIGQFAENTYFGKPSGLMDQVACATGGAVCIDFENPAEPAIEKIPVEFEKAGLRLLVVDTGANHADLTDEYAAIPADMKAIASHLGGDVLREVGADDLLDALVELRAQVGDRAVARALHFYAENDRVNAMVDALRKNAMAEYIKLMAESGRSSAEFLQNCAPVGGTDQGIVVALALTEHFFRASGIRSGREAACRVHGGGFAGTIQVLLPVDSVDAYRSFVEKHLGASAVTPLTIRNTGAVAMHGKRS